MGETHDGPPASIAARLFARASVTCCCSSSSPRVALRGPRSATRRICGMRGRGREGHLPRLRLPAGCVTRSPHAGPAHDVPFAPHQRSFSVGAGRAGTARRAARECRATGPVVAPPARRDVVVYGWAEPTTASPPTRAVLSAHQTFILYDFPVPKVTHVHSAVLPGFWDRIARVVCGF